MGDRALTGAAGHASVDPAFFRRVVGSFATGVTIVTTLDSQGCLHGLTVNSFTSVSLAPPLVLVCVERRSRSLAALRQSEVFAVNIASEAQRELSIRFATNAADKFDGVQAQRAATGAPIFADSVAWLDCRLSDIVAAGDHDVVIGKVVDMAEGSALPLGYFRGGFFNVSDEQSASQTRGQTVFSVIVDHGGRVLLCRAGEGDKWSFPEAPGDAGGLPLGGLRERLAEAGAPTTISFLYSVDEIRHRECTLLLYRGELSAKPDLADRENWRFFDAGATPWEDLLDYQTRMTLKRYFQERSQGRFGLFAETGEGGHIAPIVDNLRSYSKEDAERQLG